MIVTYIECQVSYELSIQLVHEYLGNGKVAAMAKALQGILLLCYLIVILSSSLFVVIITIHSFC
jgi:hypothetical protein